MLFLIRMLSGSMQVWLDETYMFKLVRISSSVAAGKTCWTGSSLICMCENLLLNVHSTPYIAHKEEVVLDDTSIVHALSLLDR